VSALNSSVTQLAPFQRAETGGKPIVEELAMKKDRLRKDAVEIRNVEDIIEARAEGTWHFAEDIDAIGEDVELGEGIDVDEALTFPHPRRKHREIDDIELMDTPREEDIGEDWTDQDAQPSDYEDHYDDAVDQYATDDLDRVVEDRIHDMGRIKPDIVEGQPQTEVMPGKFTPEEEEGE
jgi:hypothetical protein